MSQKKIEMRHIVAGASKEMANLMARLNISVR